MTLTPVRPQLGDDLQQPLGLGQRQARGRLVHDDQAGVERQRLGDLDHLALRDRQLGRPASRARSRRRAARAAAATWRAAAGVVDQPQQPAGQRLAADEDVGGDVEVLEQVELLVDEGDAGAPSTRSTVSAACSTPSMTIAPASGATTPPSTFISVYLPAPFSPIRPTTSPRRDATG